MLVLGVYRCAHVLFASVPTEGVRRETIIEEHLCNDMPSIITESETAYRYMGC
jgi:hypothetical protein